MTQPPFPRVVIVGGGLSGLTAAWSLHRDAPARGLRPSITVLEATARLGGNLITETVDGFQIDGGPDGWVAAKRDAETLCRDLGLGDKLIETQAPNRRVYVVHRGALVPMPEGVVLGVPTKVGPLLRSPMVSAAGKARMLLDRVLPAKSHRGDVSLGALVAERLGGEIVDALTSPLLAGVYAGDAYQLSARSTFPQLLAMAGRDRSLLRAAAMAAPTRHPGAPPPSAFLSLQGGTGSLITALASQLGDVRVHTETGAASVERVADTWRVVDTHGARHEADVVILALPAHRSARLVAPFAKALGDALSAIPYGSAATVFFALPASAVGRQLDATGFVVPKREAMDILASSWVSSKWPGRVPEGTVLLRVFVGGTAHAEHLGRPDADLVRLGWAALRKLVPITSEPLFSRVYRFVDTSPQPTVGHAARVATIRGAVQRYPGLHLLGSAYEGVGIPDVIGHARRLSTRLIEGFTAGR